MKKLLYRMRPVLLVPALVLVMGAAYAQSGGSSVPQMDYAVRMLAGDLNRKLIDERVQRIAMGQFTHRDAVPPLSAYWTNQLSDELIKI